VKPPFIDDDDFFAAKHTVLILDGLDERQLADGSDDALKGFVSSLFNLAHRINKSTCGGKKRPQDFGHDLRRLICFNTQLKSGADDEQQTT
jgi:hypothetical protein